MKSMRRVTRLWLGVLGLTLGLTLFFFGFTSQAEAGQVRGLFDSFQRYRQQNWNAQNQSWQEIKSDWQHLQDLQQSVQEEIDHQKDAFFTSAQDRFTGFVDQIVEHLQTIQANLANSQTLDETTKAELNQLLETEISWFLNQKQALQQTQTMAELRQQIRQIRTYWQKHRHRIRTTLTQVRHERLALPLERAEALLSQVGLTIQNFKNQGWDTAEAEQAFLEAQQEYHLASQSYQQAQSLWAETEPGDDPQAAQEAFRLAVSHLRAFSQKLKSVFRALRLSAPEVGRSSGQLPTVSRPTAPPDQARPRFRQPTIFIPNQPTPEAGL